MKNEPLNDITASLQYYTGEISFTAEGDPLSGIIRIKDEDWKELNIKRPPINKFGNAVLWIKTTLPAKELGDPVLFFPSGSYNQIFDAYLGNRMIFEMSEKYKKVKFVMPVNPQIVPLPGNYSEKTLYLRFATDEIGHMGIVQSVYFESERSILKRIINRQADRLILGFIFIFTGLVSSLIFFYNMKRRLYEVIGFSVMSASIGIFVVFTSDLAVLFFIDPVFSQYITLLSIIFFPVGLFLFIEKTIGPGYRKLIRRSWQIFLLLSFFALVSFLTGIRLPLVVIVVVRAMILAVSLIAAFAEMVRSLKRKNIEARVISIGLMIFGFTALYDEFVFHKGRYQEHILFPWGFFILMLMLGYLLYRAFVLSQVKLKRYSEELEEKSVILQDLNRNLEEKVQERTEELREKNKILTDRNRVIENEIAMARKIQQQLIPSHDPLDTICSLYRPMDQVGGDFYDFIDLGGKRMGFFISDVSGHGIPAALITSMIKMSIFQADSRREDPAALFTHLNEVLFGQTGDNFITAFYGIIDYSRNSMIYCNAGHNSPYVLSSYDLIEVKGKKSFPIASMHNTGLVTKKKMYENVTMDMPAESKLLLYTDGLTEAVNPDNTQVMFESVMTSLLAGNNHGSCHDVVHQLYDSLVDFRGSDSFEDDVCIVCVDC